MIMFIADEKRYEKMIYNRCGKSGLKLPAVSLGFWQNFGHKGSLANMENMVHTAFNLGITHFDLPTTTEIPTPAAPKRISARSWTECAITVTKCAFPQKPVMICGRDPTVIKTAHASI